MQGWKPDGFETYLLSDKATEHQEIFTRIEMDLLNNELLRCGAERPSTASMLACLPVLHGPIVSVLNAQAT
jgi:hypothetical protein